MKESELKERMLMLSFSDASIKSFYNMEHTEKNGKHIVTALQHYTWDFFVGEGLSVEDALKEMKSVICIYEPEFQDIRNIYGI